MSDIDTNLTTTTTTFIIDGEEANYSNPRPGSGPAPEGYSCFGTVTLDTGRIIVWAEDGGYGTYVQVPEGKLPPSWDFANLHAEECVDGWHWLSLGEDRVHLTPPWEAEFPPHVFVEAMARKAKVKVKKSNVRVTRKGIFIKGGDELGLLLEALEAYWPNQKYWLRPDCIWLLPNR